MNIEEKDLEILSAIGPIVDSHHHFWDLEANVYPWLQDAVIQTHFGDYAAIRKSYLPQNLRADLGPIELLASVHVEAHWRGGQQPEGETAWLQALGDRTGLPSGVVAYADLLSADLEKTLDAHQSCDRLRGIRMLTRRPVAPSGEALLRDDGFARGLEAVARRGLSFDLQTTAETMAASAELAGKLPGLAIALTHAGLPLDRSVEGVRSWCEGIQLLASCPNITAKLSGLPMTDWHWTDDSLRPFVEHLLDCFGPDRVMFGSNFPVDSLFSSYPRLAAAYGAIVGEAGPQALATVFRDTAARFYRLEIQNQNTGVNDD